MHINSTKNKLLKSIRNFEDLLDEACVIYGSSREDDSSTDTDYSTDSSSNSSGSSEYSYGNGNYDSLGDDHMEVAGVDSGSIGYIYKQQRVRDAAKEAGTLVREGYSNTTTSRNKNCSSNNARVMLNTYANIPGTITSTSSTSRQDRDNGNHLNLSLIHI